MLKILYSILGFIFSRLFLYMKGAGSEEIYDFNKKIELKILIIGRIIRDFFYLLTTEDKRYDKNIKII